MPILQIVTNVSKDKVDQQFTSRLTDIMAESLGKPKEYCSIHLQTVCSLIFTLHLCLTLKILVSSFFFLPGSEHHFWWHRCAMRLLESNVDWQAWRRREQEAQQSDHGRDGEEFGRESDSNVHLLSGRQSIRGRLQQVNL